MKAIFIPSFSSSPSLGGGEVLVEGPPAHHLTVVSRVAVGEKVAILDGQGGTFLAEVKVAGKKSVQLTVLEEKRETRPVNFDLGLCVPKREAMDEVIKVAVELGIRNLLPLRSQFSLKGLSEGSDRSLRLIESAMIQSNNPHFLTIVKETELKSCPMENYHHIFYFTSRNRPSSRKWTNPLPSQMAYLLLVGPEGGLTLEEETHLEGMSNLSFVHFPCPILRTPHAVGVAAGLFFSQLDKFIDANGEL